MKILYLFNIIKGEESFFDAEHNAQVLENEFVTINSKSSLENYSVYRGVTVSDSGFHMRDPILHSGSLIKFTTQPENNNWSFEYTIDLIKFYDIQKAGIYFWFTDSEIEPGDYKGGPFVFNGFVVGLEFSKATADISFSYNHGLDLGKLRNDLTKYDHINPVLIEKLNSLRIKIIHTEKNFKIELYDEENNLISDTFRVHEPGMGKNEAKSYFSITSSYSNVPQEIAYNIRSFSIHSREEGSRYNHFKTHTSYNKFPRLKDQSEVRLAIARLEYFQAYILNMLGSGEKNNIVEMLYSIKKISGPLRDQLDSLVGFAKELKKSSLKTRMTDEQQMFNGMKETLDEIAIKISAQRSILASITNSSSDFISKSCSIIFILSIFLIFFKVINFFTKEMVTIDSNLKRIKAF